MLSKISRRTYSVIICTLLPVLFLRLLWRSRKSPLYRRRWGERLGRFKSGPKESAIWIHAVSVGETIAVRPLVHHLLALENYRVVITTTTPTGSAQVKSLFGDSVFHVYVPFDTPSAVKRFLANLNVKLALIVETELWPNLIHYTHQQGIPLLLVNARLSSKSADGYMRLPEITTEMLSSVDLIAAQYQSDADQFLRLGYPEESITVTGNIKFDMELPEQLDADAAALQLLWGRDRLVWVAASTHAGEDELVLQAFAQLLINFPSLLLILVPRHPERFDEVYQLSNSLGFVTARRSAPHLIDSSTQVLIGDSMGELMLFYATADLVFVGGSLVSRGGHNFLEPSALGKPMISGPHLYNFREISQSLIDANALVLVEDAMQLAAELEQLLEHQERRTNMGVKARDFVVENRGALDKTLELVRGQLQVSQPNID